MLIKGKKKGSSSFPLSFEGFEVPKPRRTEL